MAAPHAAAGCGTATVDMLILGIESATARVGCAIGDGGGVQASVQTSRDRHHAELLAPQIATACANAGVGLRDMAAIAVDVGPGLYTGLRVGIATAVTMAHALSVPVVAVESLDLLAYRLRHTGRLITAVIDARRGEVFWARYRSTGAGIQRVDGPAVDAPGDVASQIMALGTETLVAGDGALQHRSIFERLEGVEVADPGFAHPSAGSLVLLAHSLAERGVLTPAGEVEPRYLRSPDARPDRGALGSSGVAAGDGFAGARPDREALQPGDAATGEGSPEARPDREAVS